MKKPVPQPRPPRVQAHSEPVASSEANRPQPPPRSPNPAMQLVLSPTGDVEASHDDKESKNRSEQQLTPTACCEHCRLKSDAVKKPRSSKNRNQRHCPEPAEYLGSKTPGAQPTVTDNTHSKEKRKNRNHKTKVQIAPKPKPHRVAPPTPPLSPESFSLGHEKIESIKIKPSRKAPPPPKLQLSQSSSADDKNDTSSIDLENSDDVFVEVSCNTTTGVRDEIEPTRTRPVPKKRTSIQTAKLFTETPNDSPHQFNRLSDIRENPTILKSDLSEKDDIDTGATALTAGYKNLSFENRTEVSTDGRFKYTTNSESDLNEFITISPVISSISSAKMDSTDGIRECNSPVECISKTKKENENIPHHEYDYVRPPMLSHIRKEQKLNCRTASYELALDDDLCDVVKSKSKETPCDVVKSGTERPTSLELQDVKPRAKRSDNFDTDLYDDCEVLNKPTNIPPVVKQKTTSQSDHASSRNSQTSIIPGKDSCNSSRVSSPKPPVTSLAGETRKESKAERKGKPPPTAPKPKPLRSAPPPPGQPPNVRSDANHPISSETKSIARVKVKPDKKHPPKPAPKPKTKSKHWPSWLDDKAHSKSADKDSSDKSRRKSRSTFYVDDGFELMMQQTDTQTEMKAVSSVMTDSDHIYESVSDSPHGSDDEKMKRSSSSSVIEHEKHTGAGVRLDKHTATKTKRDVRRSESDRLIVAGRPFSATSSKTSSKTITDTATCSQQIVRDPVRPPRRKAKAKSLYQEAVIASTPPVICSDDEQTSARQDGRSQESSEAKARSVSESSPLSNKSKAMTRYTVPIDIDSQDNNEEGDYVTLQDVAESLKLAVDQKETFSSKNSSDSVFSDHDDMVVSSGITAAHKVEDTEQTIYTNVDYSQSDISQKQRPPIQARKIQKPNIEAQSTSSSSCSNNNVLDNVTAENPTDDVSDAGVLTTGCSTMESAVSNLEPAGVISVDYDKLLGQSDTGDEHVCVKDDNDNIPMATPAGSDKNTNNDIGVNEFVDSDDKTTSHTEENSLVDPTKVAIGDKNLKQRVSSSSSAHSDVHTFTEDTKRGSNTYDKTNTLTPEHSLGDLMPVEVDIGEQNNNKCVSSSSSSDSDVYTYPDDPNPGSITYDKTNTLTPEHSLGQLKSVQVDIGEKNNNKRVSSSSSDSDVYAFPGDTKIINSGDYLDETGTLTPGSPTSETPSMETESHFVNTTDELDPENESDTSSNRTSASSIDDYQTYIQMDRYRMKKGSQRSLLSEKSYSGSTISSWTSNSEHEDSDFDLDPECKEKRNEQRKRTKASYTACEIMTSEETFVRILKLLNEDFRKAVHSHTMLVGKEILPFETFNLILNNLPQLQNFSEDLLKDLKERLDNWEKEPRIADIFVKKGPFLKLYSNYIRNYETTSYYFDDTRKKYEEFDRVVTEFESKPKCGALSLKSHMLKPVQRIPQYRLLLLDYKKYLTEDSPDYEIIDKAIEIVTEVAEHANKSMTFGDNLNKLLEIQNKLIGQFEVIRPGRILLKQGLLNKISRKEMQPRMFFLLSDVLLYTTPTGSGTFKLNKALPLTGMRVSKPTKDDFQNELSIITTERSFSISANVERDNVIVFDRTPSERDEWLATLRDAIGDSVQKRFSFSMNSSKNPVLVNVSEKNFKIGTRAPVWIPDARVTMCMLCTAEFSFTFRRHHCRACGKVVCGYCSDYKAPLQYLHYEPDKVCFECFNLLSGEVEKMDDRLSAQFSKATVSARFMGIRWSSFGRSDKKRAAVLHEVRASDDDVQISGYLHVCKAKKWKKVWFVLKSKVLYTYKASEDVVATESIPLLSYEVRPFTYCFQGTSPDLVFEVFHKGTQPMIMKADSRTSRDRWMNALRLATLP